MFQLIHSRYFLQYTEIFSGSSATRIFPLIDEYPFLHHYKRENTCHWKKVGKIPVTYFVVEPDMLVLKASYANHWVTVAQH